MVLKELKQAFSIVFLLLCVSLFLFYVYVERLPDDSMEEEVFFAYQRTMHSLEGPLTSEKAEQIEAMDSELSSPSSDPHTLYFQGELAREEYFSEVEETHEREMRRIGFQRISQDYLRAKEDPSIYLMVDDGDLATGHYSMSLMVAIVFTCMRFLAREDAKMLDMVRVMRFGHVKLLVRKLVMILASVIVLVALWEYARYRILVDHIGLAALSYPAKSLSVYSNVSGTINGVFWRAAALRLCGAMGIVGLTMCCYSYVWRKDLTTFVMTVPMALIGYLSRGKEMRLFPLPFALLDAQRFFLSPPMRDVGKVDGTRALAPIFSSGVFVILHILLVLGVFLIGFLRLRRAYENRHVRRSYRRLPIFLIVLCAILISGCSREKNVETVFPFYHEGRYVTKTGEDLIFVDESGGMTRFEKDPFAGEDEYPIALFYSTDTLTTWTGSEERETEYERVYDLRDGSLIRVKRTRKTQGMVWMDALLDTRTESDIDWTISDGWKKYGVDEKILYAVNPFGRIERLGPNDVHEIFEIHNGKLYYLTEAYMLRSIDLATKETKTISPFPVRWIDPTSEGWIAQGFLGTMLLDFDGRILHTFAVQVQYPSIRYGALYGLTEDGVVRARGQDIFTVYPHAVDSLLVGKRSFLVERDGRIEVLPLTNGMVEDPNEEPLPTMENDSSPH